MAKKNGSGGVTREIEPELLSPEEQAELLEAHGELRGSVQIVAGSLAKVVGRLRRPNMLIRPAALMADLRLIRVQVDEAMEALGKIAS